MSANPCNPRPVTIEVIEPEIRYNSWQTQQAEIARWAARELSQHPISFDVPAEAMERQHVLYHLVKAGGSTHRAAETLRISVRKVQYLLNGWGAPGR